VAGSAIAVLHYGLGPIGAGTLRVVAGRPGLRVVGAVDVDPDKVGRDAGEVAGLGHALGVTVSCDAERALAEARPDVVVHCTGSFLPDVMPQLRGIVAARAAVVSTCEELAYPWLRQPALAREIDDLARTMGVAVLGISTPVFWLGMMLALVFAVTLGWLPVSGYGDGALRHLVLPAVTLGALHTGTVARMTRSSLLEVVRQDFMATARAKGLSEWAVLGKHALRNALVPVVTVIGIGLADLLVGAPLTETVFAWPGVGRLLVAAVGQRDLPVVMGAVLVFALVYVLGNLLVDLAYLVIDPRMRDAARA